MVISDEEIGGDKGMREFVKTEVFRKLNVGFALDEGIATPDEIFPVFYAERSVWRMHFKCNGTSGHGSLLHENTAGEKIRRILDRVMDYRAEQVELLKNNPDFSIGDVTTVNLCILKGGVQTNVVPPELGAIFDVRLAVDVDHDAFEKMVTNLILRKVLLVTTVCFHNRQRNGVRRLVMELKSNFELNALKFHQPSSTTAILIGRHSVKL